MQLPHGYRSFFHTHINKYTKVCKLFESPENKPFSMRLNFSTKHRTWDFSSETRVEPNQLYYKAILIDHRIKNELTNNSM